MKRKYNLFLVIAIMFICTACQNPVEEKIDVEPQLSQIRSICELATMECYYHNVAKFYEKDAAGILKCENMHKST